MSTYSKKSIPIQRSSSVINDKSEFEFEMKSKVTKVTVPKCFVDFEAVLKSSDINFTTSHP